MKPFVLSTSSDSVIGAVLAQFGISHLAAAGADSSPDWHKGGVSNNLQRRFGSLFPLHNMKGVVIVVDSANRQYRVADLHELERVWRTSDIACTFTLSQLAFDRIKRDIVLTPVPTLEHA